jgi:hypothetical protein
MLDQTSLVESLVPPRTPVLAGIFPTRNRRAKHISFMSMGLALILGMGPALIMGMGPVLSM